MNISIVILNYKSKGLTLNCIRSIKEADWRDLRYEIIVIDNDSGDSLFDILAWQYPEIKFIQSPANHGMGAGNNLGLRQATGDYVVIMNPDTIAFKNTFIALYDFMENHKDVGVVGPLQYNPDKTIQDSCYRYHSLLTPFFRRTFLAKLPWAKKDLTRFLMKDTDKHQVQDVDWLLGSFLFIRRKALEQVGYFDEQFFLYFEDTDYCRRFHAKNWRVVYCPEASIIHNHSRQSASEPIYRFLTNRIMRHHIASWFKYLKKWRR